MSKKKRCLLSAFFIWTLFLAACGLFDPQPRTVPEKYLPKQYSLYSSKAAPLNRWWLNFDDPDLEKLIQTALTDNFSVKAAWARLRQADAVARQVAAERYPDLTGDASARIGRQQSGSSSTSKGIDQFSLGVISNYEVDLWGRVRASSQSAMLEAKVSRENLNTAAMTVSAEIANRWIGVIALRMQKKLLEEQLRNNNTLLELIDLRFQKSMVSALDVYQQKQVVENVKAELPLVEAEEQLILHEIATLMGKPPKSDITISKTSLPLATEVPPTGIPADLLAARPDVRAAGLQLNAADWQIAAARANRLPALSLTAQARYGESNIDELFDNWLASLAANLSAPILDGGRRAAEVDRTLAVADEKLAVYYTTVLTAIREVEDALVSEAKIKKHIDGLQMVMASARRALEEAGIRYQNGLNDYLPVLTQLTTVQQLERELIRQQASLLTARVNLYRALGGTWMTELSPPESSQISETETRSKNLPES